MAKVKDWVEFLKYCDPEWDVVVRVDDYSDHVYLFGVLPMEATRPFLENRIYTLDEYIDYSGVDEPDFNVNCVVIDAWE